MNIQSSLEQSHPVAPSPTQPLSPTEKILIPCEIDHKSGSLSEATRRKANAKASRQFRQNMREGVPLQGKHIILVIACFC